MRKNKESGYSLIELMIILAILAILLAIAIPDIKGWLPKHRLQSAARDLASNMQLAKMKAISANSYVTMTFNLPIGGTTYSYAVYIDPDKDLEYDAGEQVIAKVNLSTYKSVRFDNTKGNGDGTTFANNDNGRPSVAFDGRGLPKNNNEGFGTGSVWLETTDGNIGMKITLSSAGRITITNYK